MTYKELQFYNEYEQFYEMAERSVAFRQFCKEAFGEDLSQDGFSDIKQINRILRITPTGKDVHILDIGCGNGKMLGYIQKQTDAYIHGFDYSANAISTAIKLFPNNSDFRQGIIGEIDYPAESFDVITSMDTIYFAPDIGEFILQLIRWLKKEGILFIGYQEGDVIPKTESINTTVLAKTLQAQGIKYEVEDITKETYDLLKKKRKTALLYQNTFEQEGYKEWGDLLMLQTECVTGSYDSFSEKMARYIFTIRKS